MFAGIYLGSQPPAGAGSVVGSTRGRVTGEAGPAATSRLAVLAGPTIIGGSNPIATIQQITEY